MAAIFNAAMAAILGYFDDVLFYERTLFTILSLCLPVLYSPFYTSSVAREALPHRPPIVWAVIFLCSTLVIVQLANTIAWREAGIFPSQLSLIISLISFAGTLGVAYMFSSSYAFSFPPVIFPSLFLAVTLPYDISMAQHCLKIGTQLTSGLQVAVAAVKSLVIILSFLSRNYLFSARQTPSNHQVHLPWSGFVSISALRSNFSMEDLPSLDWDDDCKAAYQRFRTHFALADRTSDLALAKATLLTLKPHLVASVPPHLGYIACRLGLPFLILRILTTTFQADFSLQTLALNVFGTFLIFGGIGVSRLYCQLHDNRTSTAARAIWSCAIYNKTLLLNSEKIDRELMGNGRQQTMDEMDRVLKLIQGCFWGIVHVCLGMGLFLPLVGRASLLVLIPICFVAIISIFSSYSETARQEAYIVIRTSRARLMSSIIAQISTIKMMGLGSVMAHYLMRQMTSEVEALLRERRSRMAAFVLAALNHGLIPVFVLGGMTRWAPSAQTFTNASIFASLSMAAIIADAVTMVIEDLSGANVGMRSMRRTQVYLHLAEMYEWRFGFFDELPDWYPRILTSPNIGLELVGMSATSAAGHDIFRNLTMLVDPGSVAVVFGPTPCGKSTLARSIIGEAAAVEGMVRVPSADVAVCGQEVWVRNQTIKANILGVYVFVQPWYFRVLRACMLTNDLNKLQERDLAMAGSNGCNLDASLKQRIDLARAIYSRAPLIILDGILSSVRPDIAVKILFRLFGPQGIIYEYGCTVVMTTNNYMFLRHADVVFEMDSNGELQRHGNARQFIDRISSNRQYEAPIYRNVDLNKKVLSRAWDLETSTFVEDEENETTGRKLALLSYFLQPCGRRLAYTFPIAAAVAATMKKMPDIYLQVALNGEGLSERNFVVYACLVFGYVICNRVSAHATHTFMRTTPLRPILKLFTKDIPEISRDLPVSYMQLCFMTATNLLNVALLCSTARYSWIFGIVYAFMCYHAHSMFLPFFKRLCLLEHQSGAAVSAHWAETIDGIEHIRTDRRQPTFLLDFYSVLNESQKPHHHGRQAWARLILIADLFTALAAVHLVIVAYLFQASSSATALGLAFIMLTRLSDDTTFWLDSLIRLQGSLSAVLRVEHFCTTTPLEVSAIHSTVAPTWPAYGIVNFHNVTTQRSDSEEELLTAHNLEGVSFIVGPAQKAGLCAKSGHGQSALILAMLNMEDYTGRITIDGRDIRSIPINILRSRITTITQDGLELHGSVRLNLDPLAVVRPVFKDMELLRMLERVGLWQTVNSRGGLDADISEMRFTPVQRQLLGLARAALHRRRKRTQLVLIDKATSNLEGRQEKQMQDFMDGEFAAATVITVADRMTTVSTADQILTMEAGSVTRNLYMDQIDITEAEEDDDEDLI